MQVPGTLNHYRVLGAIGRGGMGEVYAAEDTRLHRKVAIKVLSSLLAADPERRRRFEREAQAIAALNHPNIVTIYSVEEADGVPFLTMELVEGKPLTELIPDHGLPPDALLRIGIAVSDAMGAAHQRGITHRDLKPANVMVTPEGRVKVLDFGLAKLREDEAPGPDDATRLPATETLTGEGKIIGTVAYMSPEQAEGKAVDQRSDIFSLGVMLHEMATGDRPFKGDTNVSVISSILKDTPGTLTDVRPGIPSGLARVVKRCLAKEPGRRYQTATDLRNDLEEVKQELDSGVTQTIVSTAPRRTARRNPFIWAGAVAAVALVAAGGWAVTRWRGGPATHAPQAFEIDRLTRLTTSGVANVASLSPDGRYVVHVKLEDAGSSLWIRQTATGSDVQIVPSSRVRYDGLTFSPDGNYVYYVTYNETGSGVAVLRRIPALGGTPTVVLEDIDSAISFSPDGTKFAFVRGAPTEGRGSLMIAAADGSIPQLLTHGPDGQLLQNEAPAWSPDGRVILINTQTLSGGIGSRVYAVDAATGALTQAGEPWGFFRDVAWMPDSRSFLIDGIDTGLNARQIWQVSYPSGERRRVTNDLNSYVGVSLSSDGHELATVQAQVQSSLRVFEGKRDRRITSGARADGAGGLAVLPDGRIVYVTNAVGNAQLFICDPDGSNARQLTSIEGQATLPVVTSDGRWIVYQGVDRTGSHIWRIAADGSGAERLTSGAGELQPVVGPERNWIYFTTIVNGQPRPFRVSIDGGQPAPLGDVYFRPISVAPDGQQIFGSAWNDQARRSEAALLPAAGGGLKYLPDAPAGARLAPDGRDYYFLAPLVRPTALLAQPVGGGPVREVARSPGEQIFFAAPGRDGAIVAAFGTTATDVVLMSARAPAGR